MEDTGKDFSKPPLEPEMPSHNHSVTHSFLLREAGLRGKTNTVPLEMQWAAEDKMIMRSHEEYQCQLPEVSRSTFLMVFSPDGKKVASTHGNHNVYVTDLTSGKNIKTLTGHPRTPWCIAFHPSSNQILATGCLGGQVRVWDLSGGSEIWTAESQTVIASLAFHPVDRMLVIASYNELHFWDWSQPQPFAKCFTTNEKEKVRYVAFDALGHKLITGVANAPARPASQWDRVAAPQPPPPNNQLDSERRITICYRYMVEQYEQLVQRYCDLRAARSTLTMDRGTDPMEQEGESSDGRSSGSQSRPGRPLCRGCDSQQAGPSRPRVASGTDEASASHSSTHFLVPSSEDSNRPLLVSSEDVSSTPPRGIPRFDITLPSFSSFRTRERSSSVPNTTTAEDSPDTTLPMSQSVEDTRPLARLSLSPDTIGFRINSSPADSQSQDNLNPREGQSENANGAARSGVTDLSSARTEGSMARRLRSLMNTWCNRRHASDGTSTEVNSNGESENEEQEQDSRPRPRSEAESQSGYVSLDRLYNPPTTTPEPTTTPRVSGSSARTEASSVSQLRSQFHRLQSVYENRDSALSPHANVFSPETQAAERRLLNRLNEILVRPLPESRARRLFASRRSAFQPRPSPASSSVNTPSAFTPPSASTAPPSTSNAPVDPASTDVIGGVRIGIQLLSRHIDNMQRLCRARLEILQLQQIRRMWEDLQTQIHALQGAVRDGEGVAGPSGQPPPPTTREPPDLLTDDDSDDPSSNGELNWRIRRTPQTSSRRSVFKSSQPRTPNRIPPTKRSRVTFRLPSERSRRLSTLLLEASRRQLNRQTSSSTQEEMGDASSSQVSGETSTGTSEERGSVRGIKRKSRDPDQLFQPRPRPSTSTSTSGSTSSAPSTSSLASVMRDTILQLENMVWRHRHGNLPRNTRLSRFTRQREERRMRNLWDTESSHESSRDDQSEGDSSHQSTEEGLDATETEWSRDNARLRARQVLLLMVDSLTQFFESDSFSRRISTEVLNDRIHNLYVLLQLALNLTDLLLAQLANSRRELEAMQPLVSPSNIYSGSPPYRRFMMRTHARMQARQLRRSQQLAFARRVMRPPRHSSTPDQPSPSPPPPPGFGPVVLSPTPSRTIPPYRQYHMHPGARTSFYASRPTVPVVRVNDLPPPPTDPNPSPRLRPHSPPPVVAPPMFVPARFLHPARYGLGSGLVLDESTSEDSSPQDRGGDFFFMRTGHGSNSVILTDTPMSPHHRIQAWDFSAFKLPDLGNADKNLVVSECKIHNDASVDMSKDGRLLVTLLPSGRLSMTTLLGVYSLQWDTLGQLLYTTSFEQSIVSVSLSPTTRHLVVGLASRRVTIVSTDRHTNAQVFRMEGASPGRKAPLGARGRLVHLRDLDLNRHFGGFMSLNCIRWAPNPGQGLVYGTNTGALKILR